MFGLVNDEKVISRGTVVEDSMLPELVNLRLIRAD